MIPVFYHVPRCGGTSVLQQLYLACWNRDRPRLMQQYAIIDDDDYVLANIFLRSSYNDFSWRIHQYHSLVPPWKHLFHRLKLNELDDVIQEYQLWIYAIVIEPRGFLQREKIFQKLSELGYDSYYQWMMFRDPFDRLQSLYHYLNSQQSKHERTHGIIAFDTFEDYIKSDRLEDSWLIRNITGAPYNIGLTEEHYHQTIGALKDVDVYDLPMLKDKISDAIELCHNQNINLHEGSYLKYDKMNANKYNKIRRRELSKEALEIFNQQTQWDQKAYAHFTQP